MSSFRTQSLPPYTCRDSLELCLTARRQAPALNSLSLDEREAQSMLPVLPELDAFTYAILTRVRLDDAIRLPEGAVDHAAIAQPTWDFLTAKTGVCDS